MVRSMRLIGIAAIGLVVTWVADGLGSNVRWLGGTLSCKGVRCEYDASGTPGGSKLTTGTCQPDDIFEAFLFCLNPADNLVGGSRRGQAFSQIVQFELGIGLGATTKTKGRSHYNLVSNAAGTADADLNGDGVITDEECDLSPTCTELRRFCTNANWVPRDVVPITFCAAMQVWECTSSDEADCPCDPTLSAGEEGACKDHDNDTANGVTPMIDEDKVLFCTLPDSEIYQFGQVLPYSCRDPLPGECPTLNP